MARWLARPGRPLRGYGTRFDQIESGNRSIISLQTTIDAARLRPCRKYSVMPSQ
jgi:hypothetical protein